MYKSLLYDSLRFAAYQSVVYSQLLHFDVLRHELLANLVEHHHPSFWTLVEALEQDEALATTTIAGDPGTDRHR